MTPIQKIYESMRLQGREITPQEVDKIMVYYLNNAPTKIPHFSTHNPAAVGPISEATNIDKSKVLQTLLTVETLVQDGDIRANILYPDAKGGIEETVEVLTEGAGNITQNVVSPTADILKQVKWIGVIALSAVGIYFAWPYLKKIRSK